MQKIILHSLFNVCLDDASGSIQTGMSHSLPLSLSLLSFPLLVCQTPSDQSEGSCHGDPPAAATILFCHEGNSNYPILSN